MACYATDGGWVRTMVEKAAAESARVPLQAKDAQALNSCLLRAERLPGWISLANKTPAEVNCLQLVALFHQIEEALLDTNGGKTAYDLAGLFRKRVREFLHETKTCPQSSVLFKKFKSRTNLGDRRGRNSISDMDDPSSNMPPLSATPHSNIKDLKTKSLSKRIQTLERIEKALEIEKDCFSSWSNLLTLVEARSYDEFAEKQILSCLVSKGLEKRDTLSAEYSVFQIYGVWARTIRSDAKFSDLKERESASFTGARRVFDFFREKLRVRSSFWPIYFYSTLGNTDVMVLCLQILMFRTSWNIESVLAINEENLSYENGRLILQSKKSRTDSDTPPCEIKKGDRLANWALDFLRSRRLVMLANGFLVADTLFASANSYGPITAISKALKDFQDKHSLPRYSSEQIRKEMLGYTNATRGFSAAQREAGHANISQTGFYTDDAIERTENSSICFEFERRVEKDIRACIADTTASRNWPSMTAIGDGASCANPFMPPVESWLEGERCAGKDCHSNCINRRVVITEERMSEIVHTEAYYKLRWRSLRDQNKDRFNRIHLPKILFVKCITSILLTGPYSSEFEAIRERGQTQPK